MLVYAKSVIEKTREFTEEKERLKKKKGWLDLQKRSVGICCVRRFPLLRKNKFGNEGIGGHIFNLGYGVNIDMDPEVVHDLVEYVHEESRKFHKN